MNQPAVQKEVSTAPQEELLCMECILAESMVLVAKIPSIIQTTPFYFVPAWHHFRR